MSSTNITKIISALIDDDLIEADFEKARSICDIIEQEIYRARKYMDEMDRLAEED